MKNSAIALLLVCTSFMTSSAFAQNQFDVVWECYEAENPEEIFMSIRFFQKEKKNELYLAAVSHQERESSRGAIVIVPKHELQSNSYMEFKGDFLAQYQDNFIKNIVITNTKIHKNFRLANVQYRQWHLNKIVDRDLACKEKMKLK